MSKLVENILFENVANSNIVFKQHIHNTYSIGITRKGLFKSLNNRNTHNSYKFSTRVNNPQELHGGNAQEWSNSYFYPTIEEMSDIYFQIFGKKQIPIFSSHIIEDIVLYKKLHILFQNILEKRDKLQIEYNAIDALSYLILNYSNKEKTLENSFDNKKTITNSIEFINDNLSKNLDLDILSNNINLSKYHFLRIFKKELGLTPHQYIINQRIENAKLLITKGHSIVEAALEVGFNDQSHFNRNFKQFYDYSPTKLIKNRNFIL